MTESSHEMEESKEIDIKSGDTCVGFDLDQAKRAIVALQDHASRKFADSSNSPVEIFGDDRSLYLDIVMKKYPVHLPTVTFLEMVLPHPFHDPQTASSCIFVRDVDKRVRRQDIDKSSRVYKEFFAEEHQLTDFTEVISVKQLMSEYKSYGAKSKLCNSYDVFMADKRLIGRITKWLGKEFVQARKVPFPMSVTKNVRRQFKRVFTMTRAVLTPSSIKFSVKIGRLQRPVDHLVKNLEAVTKYLASRMPGNWKNVRSAYLSLPSIIDLPVYVDWGSSNEIEFRKPMRKNVGFVEDELTTLPAKNDGPAGTVRVYGDGAVRLGKKKDQKKQQRQMYWDPPKKSGSKLKKGKSRIPVKRTSSRKVKKEIKEEM